MTETFPGAQQGRAGENVIDTVIKGTVYRSEESGYTVLETAVGKKQVTVVGVLPAFAAGERVRFFGAWTQHPQYGPQWRATQCEVEPPNSLKGIESFLSSGLIRGMGPDTARRVMAHFGKQAMDILAASPERLAEVKGIGPKKARMIGDSFREKYSMRRAMVFLGGYGIPPKLSIRIAKRYGERVEEVLKENPYRLVDDVEGIGFLTADRIAVALGLSPESPYRSEAALKYVLQEAALSGGHTYLPEEMLLREASSLLRCAREPVEAALKNLILNREIVVNDFSSGRGCMLERFYHAEKEVAVRLSQLMRHSRGMEAHMGAAAAKKLEKIAGERGLTLSPRQQEAVLSAVTHGVMVITGGPGTGKTTIIRCILSLLGPGVMLAAPTGRAAKRMSEACGREARTLHRLLEYGGDEGVFQRNEENPLEGDSVIVDEMSMVDVFLMRSLLRALKTGTRLIMVGDADQLPSVGAGNVLSDVLQSGVIPSVRLTEVFRQAEESMIVRNAHAINQGRMPVWNGRGTDFFFERKQTAEEAAAAVVALCRERLPKYLANENRQDIQVLSPSRKGVCGVENLNRLLQAALNPPARHKKELQSGETVFRTGDKVMHIRNDYSLEWHCDSKGTFGAGVFNGDMGVITAVDPEEKTVSVLYDGDIQVEYDSGVLDELDLSYCLSIHKSQGSEFSCVVMPCVGGPPMLLTRNLFYTALTRARRLVVLVGRESCVEQMVNNNEERRRYTSLLKRLAETAEDV